MASMALFTFLATIVLVSAEDVAEVKVKLRADISNIKTQVQGMQGNTDLLTTSLDAFDNDLDNYIKDEDATADRTKKIKDVTTVVDGTIKALPKFKSGESSQIVSGILDMTSMALATFGGPHGAAFAVVLNIVSALISLFTSSPKSSPAIDKVMRKVLEEFQDEQLQRKMNSFLATFDKVHYGLVASRKYSRDIEGKDLSEDDITALKTEIKTFETSTLLEDVKQSIADNIVSGTVSDAKKVLKTLNIYCQLTAVIELVIFEFVSYIEDEQSGSSVLPTYYHSFVNRKRIRDTTYLEFLHLPDITQAITAAIYQNKPEDYPALRDYIGHIKVTPIPDSGLTDGQIIYLTPKKFPTWHLYLSSESHSAIYGSKSTNDQNKFILRKAQIGEEGKEWKLENKYYPNYFFTASKYSGCMPLSHPDTVSHVEGLTMEYIRNLRGSCHKQCLANYKCSGCYANCLSYFKIGRIRGLRSVNYVWRFTKLKSTSSCTYYLISAIQEQFGPGYTLLMKDSGNANGYLKYGNPGENGKFSITKNAC